MSCDDIGALIEKAKESLVVARDLLRGSHDDFAASRAYYAMFYVAEDSCSRSDNHTANTLGSSPRSEGSTRRPAYSTRSSIVGCSMPRTSETSATTGWAPMFRGRRLNPSACGRRSSSGLPRSIFPGEAIDRNGSRALVRVPGRDRPCPGW